MYRAGYNFWMTVQVMVASSIRECQRFSETSRAVKFLAFPGYGKYFKVGLVEDLDYKDSWCLGVGVRKDSAQGRRVCSNWKSRWFISTERSGEPRLIYHDIYIYTYRHHWISLVYPSIFLSTTILFLELPRAKLAPSLQDDPRMSWSASSVSGLPRAVTTRPAWMSTSVEWRTVGPWESNALCVGQTMKQWKTLKQLKMIPMIKWVWKMEWSQFQRIIINHHHCPVNKWPLCNCTI